MKKIISILAILIALSAPRAAIAQGAEAQIIGSTQPVSAELIAAAETWLNENHPADTPYYAITYIQSSATGVYLCLAGLRLTGPEDAWDIEDNGIWFGTIKVLPGGGAVPFTAGPARHGGNKLASQARAAGGGSYLRFPWDGGKSMVYGQRGVHGNGDFGTSGMLAVDLVGGDRLGSNIASNTVYAVDAGEIDYVCDDSTTVAVRTYNATTGDYFLYAHLLDNANLALEQTFAQSAVIGQLKYGTFASAGCGWAQQQPTNYHLHFMFTPGDGLMQFEGCILTIASQHWSCGSTGVYIGETLYSNGSGIPPGEDDPGDGTNIPTAAVAAFNFFDLIVAGMVRVAMMPLTLMPDPNSSYWTFRDNVVNTVLVLLKITRVLFMGNFSVGLFLATMTFFLTMEIGTFLIRIFIKLAKLVGSLMKLL